MRASPLIRGVRLLAPYLPPRYRWWFAGLAALGVAVGALEALVLAFIGPLASSLNDEGTETVDVALLGPTQPWTVVWIGVTALLLSLALRALEARAVASFGTRPLVAMRDTLLRSYLRSTDSKQQSERAGELQDLLMSHVPKAGFLVYFVAGAVAAGAVFTTLALAAAVVDPLAFLVILGVVAVLAALMIPLQRTARRFGTLQNESSLSYAADSAEATNAARELRLFDAAEPMATKLDGQSAVVAHQIYRAKLATLFTPNLYRSLVLAFLLFGLGLMVTGGANDTAAASTVVLLLIRALMASQIVNTYTQTAAEYVPFVEEIDARVRQYRDNREIRGDLTLGPIEQVRFDRVSFAYDADPVLADLDLSIQKGERIGILGVSGSGKTTLLSLLVGLTEPTVGGIAVNGHRPTAFDAGSWARQVATVPQAPLVLTASVRDNIRFFRGDEGSLTVEDAARSAGIHDEIMSWPDGYDTVIGERGVRALSGGQKQRICIARALFGRPTLLILDEPTSALDAAAESVVADTIEALGVDCTVVVVSHRPAALEPCDRLIEIVDGRAVSSTPAS